MNRGEQQLARLWSHFNLLMPPTAAPLLTRDDHAGWRQAAVLIPLILQPDGLQLLLTRRSPHLRHHPGQISFPGGRRDPLDTSLQHTALRETHEELGIAPSMVQLLGQLPVHATHSQFLITPYLGVLRQMPALQPAAGEVAEAFTLPLAPCYKPPPMAVGCSNAKVKLKRCSAFSYRAVSSGAPPHTCYGSWPFT